MWEIHVQSLFCLKGFEPPSPRRALEPVLEGPFPAVCSQLAPPAQGLGRNRGCCGCPLSPGYSPAPQIWPYCPPSARGSVEAEMLCARCRSFSGSDHSQLHYTKMLCIHNRIPEVILGLGMDAGRQNVSPSLFHTIIPRPSPSKWEIS